MNLRRLRPDLYRFWLLMLTQQSLERCSRAVLFTFFRNPYMCRPAVLIQGHPDGRFGGGGGHLEERRLEEGQNNELENLDYRESGDKGRPQRPLAAEEDFQWCVVSGAAYRLDLRVLGPACEFDALCGGVVYSPSRPPAFVGVFLVGVSLFLSLIGVWLPRLMFYKTRNKIAFRLQKACRRALLRLVLAMSLVRVLLEVQLLLLFPKSVSNTGPITLGICLVIGSAIIYKFVKPTSKTMIHRVEMLPLSATEVF